ncbi:MAG: class I SAM-dependent methyltransferase [Pseudomonadota bacterium]
MLQAKIVDYSYNLTVREKNGFVDRILQKNNAVFVELLSEMAAFNGDFETIEFDGQDSGTLPFWNNPWFSGFDACSIYYFIAKYKPKYYLEVGSGNSTKFAKLAVQNRSPETKIISIDPEPREEIDSICDEVIRNRFENVDLSSIDFLSENDIVFIDNSHRSFQNSDVTVCFTELVPMLPKGIIFGFHDIFLPYDYPQGWAGRLYNEQYMLATYLLSGHVHDTVILPLCYLARADDPDIQKAMEAVCPRETFGDTFQRGGGCFWLRRDGEPDLI